MDTFSFDPAPRDVPALLREAVRRQHQLLKMRAIIDGEPTWLDASQPRCGAPDFFWALFTATFSREGVEALLARPDWLAELLVEAWRRWRARWIAGEWQA